MSNELNKIKKLMYNNYKRQMMIIYFQSIDFNIVSDSLFYALSHDVYPFFHENEEVEVYADCFCVKKEFVSAVIKHIDEKVLTKDLNKLDFYSLEEKFGGYKQYRSELIHILRYCYLARRFNADVWNKIISDAPAEVGFVTSNFDASDDIQVFS